MKRTIIIITMATMFLACNNNAKEQAMAKQQAIIAIRDSLKLDSFKRAEAAQKQAKLADNHSAARTYSSSSKTSQTNAGKVTNKKQGWSDAAKGTVIGAGVGALGGILIDKKDGRGAIIGGLTGAGAGYMIGRAKDRKSGRVQKNN